VCRHRANTVLFAPRPRLIAQSRRYFEALSAGGGPSMPIEPGEHEVNAAVEVTFALEIGPAS